MRRSALAVAALLALGGCTYDYVRPMDRRGIPAATAARTHGGQELLVDEDGSLFWRPGDVAAALGVTLADGPGGVTVAAVGTEVATGLEVGDRIVLVGPLPPGLDLAVVERLPPPEPPELRGRGHEVSSLLDLRGYALCPVVLDLLVVRRGRELALRWPVAQPEQVARPLWMAAATRQLGFEACRVDDLPAHLVPAHATPGRGDVLVTQVALGSPVGVDGLRPLDVVASVGQARDAVELFGVTEFGQLDGVRVRVLRPDGSERELLLPWPTAPLESEGLLGLWVVEQDPTRSHVGVGPMDLLFHYHDELQYEPRSDAYLERASWSLLTVFQATSVEGDGRMDYDMVKVNPISDEARGAYFAELMSGELLEPR